MADQYLERLVGVVTESRCDRTQPADVAVVIGAEHVDAAVETALPLVEVVRSVGTEIGRLAVATDQHPILVVAEVSGAKPDRALLLEDVPLVSQPRDRPLQLALFMQGPLGEPDVEVDPEVPQRQLDAGEHQRDALPGEDVDRLVLRLVQQPRVIGDHLCRDLGDVRPGVAVLRRRLARWRRRTTTRRTGRPGCRRH